MDNTSKVVWFFAGAALGSTIALLYAPQTGKDTRRYIGKQARKSREAIEDVSRDLADKGRELYEQGRRVADDAAELFERGRRLVGG